MRVALLMLLGDRARFAGIVLGLAFASLLIAQQGAIFAGIVARTYGVISDAGYADVWVMDPRVEVVDDPIPLPDAALDRVRGVPGVLAAEPLLRTFATATLPEGREQACVVTALDDATLLGGPPLLLQGHLEDLRQPDGVIVDDVGAADKLRRPGRPMAVGDAFEVNGHRAVVTGICRVTRSFQSQPVIYTTYDRALAWAPPARRQLTFILVKRTAAAAGEPGGAAALCARIHAATGLAAYPTNRFARMTADYVLARTGILVNFAIGIGMGILVGAAIAGQAFYNFTLDNRRHFAVLKAMGLRPMELLAMILLQGLIAGIIGFGCGVGGAALFGWSVRDSELAFLLPWQLLAGSCAIVLLIVAGAAVASIAKVLRLAPAAVFRP